nr:MAG TPA: Radical SAM superfamily [Caudoviricetes sp.]
MKTRLVEQIDKWFRRQAHIFYTKWMKGECHHICAFCSYRNQCYDNLEV